MFVKFSLINLETGREHVPAYVDAEIISSWTPWETPDPAPQGIHRSLRGRALVVLNFKTGMMHWCEESFDAVSARILAARGQHEEAKVHETAAALHAPKSPLAV